LEFDVMCENINAVLSFRWPEDKVKCFGHFSRSKLFPFFYIVQWLRYDSVFFYVFINASGVYEFDPTFYRTTFLFVYLWLLYVRSVDIHC
jgi:hypothetical protein